jgi:hypothetical protein
MNYYPHDELEAIEANPKRRDVVKLVAEVKRLTAIALTAEQYLNNRAPSVHARFESDPCFKLGTKKSEWPVYGGNGG